MHLISCTAAWFDKKAAALAQYVCVPFLVILLGPILLTAGVLLNAALERTVQPDWISFAFRCIVAFCALVPVFLGSSALAKRVALKRAQYQLYTQVKLAALGYWFWQLSTMFCAALGIVSLMSGFSPLAGVVGFFSVIFVVLAIVLETIPQRGSTPESLKPLSRVAAWQVIIAGAVTAMEYPGPGKSLTNALGDNHTIFFGLLLVWAFSAGLFIILLEPLRHGLTEMSSLERRLWQTHHPSQRVPGNGRTPKGDGAMSTHSDNLSDH